MTEWRPIERIAELEAEVKRLDRELFDCGAANDSWALEVDQLKAQLAAADARIASLAEEWNRQAADLRDKNKRLVAADARVEQLSNQLNSANGELEDVTNCIDDVLYDPRFYPRDEYGDLIIGDDWYLVPHRVQEDHMPALRAWFVQRCENVNEQKEAEAAGGESCPK